MPRTLRSFADHVRRGPFIAEMESQHCEVSRRTATVLRGLVAYGTRSSPDSSPDRAGLHHSNGKSDAPEGTAPFPSSGADERVEWVRYLLLNSLFLREYLPTQGPFSHALQIVCGAHLAWTIADQSDTGKEQVFGEFAEILTCWCRLLGTPQMRRAFVQSSRSCNPEWIS